MNGFDLAYLSGAHLGFMSPYLNTNKNWKKHPRKHSRKPFRAEGPSIFLSRKERPASAVFDDKASKWHMIHYNQSLAAQCRIWQYGLWSFQTGGTKLERFLPMNQHTQRKFMNFENWTNGEVSKSAKSPNLPVFKVNFLYQKLSESFSIFFQWRISI